MDARVKAGVSVRSAVKRYGQVAALDDVSLDVAPGEFVSLLGPSGSGKTTLLGILGGFVQPTSGSVWVGDRDITFVQPHKRNIGIVFQNYALFPHMTVGENVAFALRARREPKAGWARRVADALAMVELGGYEHRRIASLSGGQRQRVALARAMVFEPQLILMDEPLSALDKQLRETMQIELRRLHRRLGATIIYVTHDQREALTMSDRVAVLRNGKLVQIDTPERLYDRPCNAFVASFIGEATLLPVTRAGTDMVRLGDSVLRASAPLPHADTLLLAVQTEKLVIADAGTPSTANRLSARVTEVLYQGESLRVFATLPDGTALSLRQPGNHEARQRIPAPGAAISVALDPRDTIVVPA
ncbi:Spermidine/putrescine import ATP-binding protein PotA [Burkholderia gladioli]|uniref:ABC transporter ATP-binding protein n=1 Tax=Burkholderia gladioli TaxID=28095 RepID=UPI0003A89323|nr:ABC transporter ATP-binding protein [Burkholderia gladioli]NHH81268.1 putative 2-aminoethylphosphonate import ATP-binding protein PhnT [Burkholderia gladioli]CAG9203852.1 Spermidine/putrescine import ATP-binding protein PotA [Burkholderia gladioli]